MRYAIIAAGEGSRLAHEGIKVPKPLVEVKGETLIGRLLRVFAELDAEEIVIITREDYDIPEVKPLGCKVQRMVKETESSMHSFYEMLPLLENGPFILTTVDTFFDETLFREYVDYFTKAVEEGYDGVMAVTDYIDDEKPLYVATDCDVDTVGDAMADLNKQMHQSSRLLISGFLDEDPEQRCEYISAGIYGFTSKALDTLKRCMAEGQSRMRNFQRGLVSDGLRLLAFPMGKVVDIDHIKDIEAISE